MVQKGVFKYETRKLPTKLFYSDVIEEEIEKISRLLKDAINEGLIKNGPKKTYIPFWAKH